jgi:hypothetical protein
MLLAQQTSVCFLSKWQKHCRCKPYVTDHSTLDIPHVYYFIFKFCWNRSTFSLVILAKMTKSAQIPFSSSQTISYALLMFILLLSSFY